MIQATGIRKSYGMTLSFMMISGVIFGFLACFHPDFVMSINLSYDQVKEAGFRQFVIDTLERFALPPKAITLELTESKIIADWAFINKEFDAFRRLGISIAMDDFGTGYSSLSMLKNLSCDIIKIDREFVKDILSQDFDYRLVKYTVDLCHSIGMTVVMEGVEEEAAYRLLADEIDADIIQGYLFGRPEPIAEFEKKFLA